jgi:hypothetical protein
MSRWFRIYDDLVHDRKVQDLPGPTFKGWVNILCLASKHEGILPPLGDIAFALRLPIQKASQLVDALTSAGLIDQIADGQLSPHNWDQRQHKSDCSTDRVKLHRERKRNVPLKLIETS